MISATQIYNYVQCPHRVSLDVFGNPAERDEPNAFVELLWEQGITHENAIVATLGITANLKEIYLPNVNKPHWPQLVVMRSLSMVAVLLLATLLVSQIYWNCEVINTYRVILNLGLVSMAMKVMGSSKSTMPFSLLIMSRY